MIRATCPGSTPLKLLPLALLCWSAHASNYRVGASLGYGGAGATQQKTIQGDTISVQRSEAPGMMNVFVERLLSDRFELALEHERGFRIGPFSSGVSLTGVALRRYFMAPAPSMEEPREGQSSLLVRRYVPFVGLGTGVATADITRKGDLVPSLTGSTLYVSLKIGADYQYQPGLGFRTEIAASTSLMSTEQQPTTLSAFALQFGIFLDL